MNDMQMSLFDTHEEETDDFLPMIIVTIDGKKYRKQVLHVLNGNLYAVDHDGFAYAFPIENSTD